MRNEHALVQERVMLNRLALGFVLGMIVGACGALGLIVELGWSTVSASAAYVLAAATGATMGLVAGRPLWAREAALEASLKALFGAVSATLAVFVLRRWLVADVDLELLHAGKGSLGEVPAAFLPMIAVALGCFYEIDDRVKLAAGAEADRAPRLRAEVSARPARASRGGLPVDGPLEESGGEDDLAALEEPRERFVDGDVDEGRGASPLRLR